MNIEKLLKYFNEKKFDIIIDSLKNKNFDNEKNFQIPFLLSLSYFNSNKPNESLTHINQALLKSKNNPEIYFNKAIILEKLGKLDEALRNYLKTIELDKKNFQAYNNMALLYFKKKKYFLSIKNFKLSILINKNYWQAYYNLGLLFFEINKFKSALNNFLIVRDLINKNKNAYVYLFIGDCYFKTKSLDKAYENYKTAKEINQNLFEAYNGIGNYYYELNKYTLAKNNYENALKINPNFYKAFYNIGKVFRELHNFDKAIMYFDKAISIKPDYNLAKFSKSICFFHLRKFKEGWSLYEFRDHENYIKKLLNRYPKKNFKKDFSLKNKKILIIHEQGFGDTIQFSRYIKNLLTLGCLIDFKPQKSLIELMTFLKLNINLVNEINNFKSYDYIIPLMSIPNILDIDFENITQNDQYIFPKIENIKKWKTKLNLKKFNIGVNWQGSTKEADKGRSFRLSNFEEISKISNVQLISLQKYEGTDQLNSFKGDIINFDQELDSKSSFVDTAALLVNLDLVITSDTSIAHLAGSLGCKTWLVLQKTPDWRWGVDIDKMPNYKNMISFRQKNYGEWSHPFSKIKESLLKLLNEK